MDKRTILLFMIIISVITSLNYYEDYTEAKEVERLKVEVLWITRNKIKIQENYDLVVPIKDFDNKLNWLKQYTDILNQKLKEMEEDILLLEEKNIVGKDDLITFKKLYYDNLRLMNAVVKRIEKNNINN